MSKEEAFKFLTEEKKVKVKANTPVKGVKYKCGCRAGSNKLIAIMYFPKYCTEHDEPVVAFWRDERND